MPKQKNKQKLDLIFLIVYPIIATGLSLAFRTNVLMSVILFLALPSLYLSLKAPKCVARSALFSVSILLFFIVMDFISYKTHQWVVPQTVFPFRLFGEIPLEDLLWAFFLTHYTIMFYEYFLHKHFKQKFWYPKMKYWVALSLLIPAFMFLITLTYPKFIHFKYFYATWGVLGILLPVILVELKFPKLIARYIKAGMYFFYVTFLYEMTALTLGWWYFPKETQFIGLVNIWGRVLPLEEFILWLMLLAMATLTWFEYFDDNNK